MLERHPGDLPVFFEFSRPGGEKLRLEAGDEFRVTQTRELVQALMIWL